jgi:DNA repair exonuclease SbcCD ATPase subunit
MAEKTPVQGTARESTRAVQFVREELESHIELGNADSDAKLLMAEGVVNLLKAMDSDVPPTTLSKVAEDIFNIIGALDQATEDLLAGARLEVAELAKQLEEAQRAAPQAQPIDPQLFKRIASEIKRRQEWAERARELQEALEDERDRRRERMGILNDLLKHGASENEASTKKEKRTLESSLEGTESTIARMIKDIALNERAVEELIKYQQAVETLKTPPWRILDAPLRDVPPITKNATTR